VNDVSSGPRSTEIDERYYVDAAARTLQLLKVVAEIDAPAPLTLLVSRLGWSKPAVYRLVRTLEAVGGLRLHDGKGYVLGPALITLVHAAVRATRLTDIARPHLEDLHEQLDETIVLTVLDGDEVVYVDRVEADKILIPRTRLGSRLPAYATSTGQVLLSGLDDDEVRRRLKGRAFEPLAPNTLRDLDELLERLAEIRRRGYAINDEELAIGHRSVAAPVRDHSGDLVAAVSVSVPAARASRSQLAGFATEALVPAAEAISAGLGAVPALVA
jgi:IclR family transcriptional regulator, pca regulon regulatory protein